MSTLRKHSVCHLLIVLSGICVNSPTTSAEVIGFEDLTLPGPETFYNGNPGSPVINTTYDGTFTSGSATFVNEFTRFDFGFGPFDAWQGWSYSNVTDQVIAGPANQYSAWNPATGGGGSGGSSMFGVSFGDDAWVGLPIGSHFTSVDFTNTTYAARSMLDGDPFAKKFGGASGTDPDFFRINITGRQGGLSGTVVYTTEFYLADFRFANSADDYVISDWTTLNLSLLGAADTLQFTYSSSDTGIYGINTPTYFAADNFVAMSSTVPEPSVCGMIAGIAALAVCRRRRPIKLLYHSVSQ